MTFLQLIFALVVERAIPESLERRRYDWFIPYVDRVEQLFSRLPDRATWLRTLAILFIPVVLVLAITMLLEGYLYGLLSFAFGIVILFYSLGPKDLDTEVQGLIGAIDTQEEFDRQAREFLKPQLPGAVDELQCVKHVFSESHERIFGVIFWFVLLGPVGALLYRLIVIMNEDDQYANRSHPGVNRLHGLLAWIPSRLLIFGFALAGDFGRAIQAWNESEGRPVDPVSEPSSILIQRVGMAAVNVEASTEEGSSLQAGMSLVWRTLVLWLVVIALLTIGAWLG